jgi:phosphoserine phosphatase RsbU/P
VLLTGSLADRIASSVENLRLQEQQRLIAHTLQQSLLPSGLPAIPGIEIAVRYWPAGEGIDVGGDFYDVFSLNEPGRWAVVIGDVCGTGPAAASLTGLARHSIRASAWHGDSAAEVLTSLNHAVLNSGTNSYLTAVYATLDTDGASPTLTVACGGHPPPIHVSGHGSKTIGASGTLLGLFDEVHISERVTQLEPGDTVAFYTDGATDLPPPHGLAYEQLTEMVADAAHGSSSVNSVADRLHDALEALLPFRQRNDDIALLILRTTEPDQPR